MLPSLPEAVRRYLAEAADNIINPAYFRLDKNNRIMLCGGDLSQCGVQWVDITKPIDEQVDFLFGLLPNHDAPVVIRNAQTKREQFVDLHLFLDGGKQWVLLCNNTKAALQLQLEQQNRLNIDFINEKRIGYR